LVVKKAVNSRSDEAVEEFQRALDLNPNFAAAHGFLGCALAPGRAQNPDALRATRADFDPNGFGSSSPITPATQCSLGAVISGRGRTPDQFLQFFEVAELRLGI
jgi:hypothetical protein